MKPNYYQLLNIPKTASQEEIRRAFRRLSKRYHPDVNQGSREAEDYLKKIIAAYEVLSDPEKRRVYDLILSASFTNTQSSRSRPAHTDYPTETNRYQEQKQENKYENPTSTIGLSYHARVVMSMIFALFIFALNLCRGDFFHSEPRPIYDQPGNSPGNILQEDQLQRVRQRLEKLNDLDVKEMQQEELRKAWEKGKREKEEK